jgi:hypothetical protein
LQKTNYLGDSKIYNLKEYLCSKFEDELRKSGYLDNNKTLEILSKGLKEHFGINPVEPNNGVYKPLWWIFVTPNFKAYVSVDGKEDYSGIYNFDRKKVEEGFNKYYDILKNRLKQSLCKFN